jgi:thioredoxin-like negative regulator of GroEL
MPRRSVRFRHSGRRRDPDRARPLHRTGQGWPSWAKLGAAALLASAVLGGVTIVARLPESSSALRMKAEAAANDGNWPRALELWRVVNRARGADARSYLAEARACLALGRAGQAEQALTEASRHDPRDAEAWLIRQEITRVENRQHDAQKLTWEAYEVVAPESRHSLLLGLTLALLADAPDDLARDTLTRWIDADPGDLEARAALERRRIDNPRASDPPFTERAAELERLLAIHPEHTGLREALILVLAEAGDPARGRVSLDAWPESERDVRHDRLEGRWSLDYENRPERAVAAFKRALAVLPHDWKARYRLTRALQAAGLGAEARQQAGEVARLRELLEPVKLGQRLDSIFETHDRPGMARELAQLCASAGLERLAEAWRKLAAIPDAGAELDKPSMRLDLPGRLPARGEPSR